MLVLTRKLNEAIVIGQEIEITILEIKGDQVRIGINAPKTTNILRKELYLELTEANKEALKSIENINKIIDI